MLFSARALQSNEAALVGLGANAALRALVVLVALAAPRALAGVLRATYMAPLVALPALGVLADVLCATYMAPFV